MPRCRPDWARNFLISFSDFRPKFDVLSISAPELPHKLADVVDSAVLQAVRRSDGQFEFVQPFQHFADLLRHKFDIRWRPLRHGQAQMEADLCQDFLQVVGRLPSEIREAEQFGFAFLSEPTAQRFKQVGA